jgi:hypothetical protein
MVMKISIFGFREENGMLLVAASRNNNERTNIIRFLTNRYNSEQAARDYVCGLISAARTVFPGNPEFYNLRFYSIEKLCNYLDIFNDDDFIPTKVSCMYIWSNGEWTCSLPSLPIDNGVLPLDAKRIRSGGKKLPFIKIPKENRAEWFARFFPFPYGE